MVKKTMILFMSLFLFTMPAMVMTAGTVDEPKQVSKLNYEDESCLALNYHRVRDFHLLEILLKNLSNSRELNTYSVSKEAFHDQMKWLHETGANFLSQDEFIRSYEAGDFPEKCVWISFDDMDQTIYDNAHETLEKFDIPATGFVITGEVGNLSFNNLNLMSEDELLELERSGLWKFESHTHKMHHVNDNRAIILSRTPKEINDDLTESMAYLGKTFDSRLDMVAYPYGQANDKVTDVLIDKDIRYGFSLEEKAVTPESPEYYIPRVLVSESAFESLIKQWEGFE